MITTLLGLVPSWLYAAIVAALALTNCASHIRAEHAVSSLATYKAQVAQADAAGAAIRMDATNRAFRNAERVDTNVTLREKTSAAERTALAATVAGLSSELSAAQQRIAGSANVAACAARAAKLGQLYETSEQEYQRLATAAEADRLKAVGLFEYIQGNALCAKPAGVARPAVADDGGVSPQ